MLAKMDVATHSRRCANASISYPQQRSARYFVIFQKSSIATKSCRCPVPLTLRWHANRNPTAWLRNAQPRLLKLSPLAASSNEISRNDNQLVNTDGLPDPSAPTALQTDAATIHPPLTPTSQPDGGEIPPVAPRRGRLTMDQMQREARTKLGDLVRQQYDTHGQQSAAQQQQRTETESDPLHTPPLSASSTLGMDVSSSRRPDVSRAVDRSSEIAAASKSEGAQIPQGSATAVAEPAEVDSADAADTDLVSEWEMMWREVADEGSRIRERWSQFLERPLEATSAPLRQNQEQSSSQSPAGEGAAIVTTADGTSGSDAVRRRVLVSRALQLACVAVFLVQWAPIAQALMGGTAAAAPGREVWMALMVACPPTPLTLTFQADAVSLFTGQWGCLLTSALLHSGLLSLMVSLASLEETLPWLETIDGFMIMLLSYGIVAAAAGLAQLWLGSQSAAIGGIATAVGMEVAVAVRCWRYSGGQLMPPSVACLVLLGVAALMAAYQPLVGPWSILGGALGGALSAVLAYDVLYVMRVVLAILIMLGVGAWEILTWIPLTMWRLGVGVGMFAWSTVTVVVQALRGV